MKYKAKGILNFYLKNGKLCEKHVSIEQIVKSNLIFVEDKKFEQYIKDNVEKRYTFEIFSLIPGSDFLDMIDNQCIIDNDGDLAAVFVDGYMSNLGLVHKDFLQGNFLVDSDEWRKICSEHDIEVNWANK